MNIRVGSIFVVLLFLIGFQPRFYPSESIEAVFNALNPDLLSHDFYMQTLEGFHHQFYFGHFVGWFISLFSLSPEITLSWMALFNLLLTFGALYYSCRIINPSDRLLPFFAVTLLTVTPPLFVLGGWSLLLPFIRPWIMVQPFLIMALTWCWQGRVFFAVTAAGVAALFHPLLGGTIGVICMVAGWENKKETFLAFLLFSILMLPNAIPAFLSYQSMKLETMTFIEIIANYRHPMHYIPSSWEFGHFLHFFWATAAISICLLQANVRAILNRRAIVMGICFFALMLSGYLFVEVYPTRLGTTLIGFRYSIYLYLFYLVILSKYLSTYTQKGEEGFVLTLALITSIFLTHNPLIIFIILLLWHFSKQNLVTARVLFAIAIAAALRSSVKHVDLMSMIQCGVVLGLITLTIYPKFINQYPSLLKNWVFGNSKPSAIDRARDLGVIENSNFSSAISIASGMLACFLVWQTTTAPERYWNHEGKNISQVIEAVKAHTLASAIIVTPIEGEVIRIQGQRALVGSHHFPFLDKHFIPWYERAKAVWGIESLERSAAKKAYIAISDEQLNNLQLEYGATHAVLYPETFTKFKVLYENNHYKLVEISNE